jgi:hypothetical protein
MVEILWGNVDYLADDLDIPFTSRRAGARLCPAAATRR